MLYVQQSLGSEEEVLIAGRFHWMYTVKAVFWILFGLAIGIAVGYGAIWMMVTETIRETYPGLPDELFDKAWGMVVESKGGYLKILWTVNPILRFSILGFFVLGLFFFVHLMIVKATTEIAVTNERVIYKKWMIARHVGELGVDRIEGTSVSQGLWGRIFGYGRVTVRGMGVGEVILPPIENPIIFRQAVQEALTMKSKNRSKKSSDNNNF